MLTRLLHKTLETHIGKHFFSGLNTFSVNALCIKYPVHTKTLL